MLVSTLVISRIDYCCSLLMGIKSDLMDKVERVIKSAVQIILKCGRLLDEEGFFVMSAEKRRAVTIVWMELK
jgi:hypothetical protein